MHLLKYSFYQRCEIATHDCAKKDNLTIGYLSILVENKDLAKTNLATRQIFRSSLYLTIQLKLMLVFKIHAKDAPTISFANMTLKIK